jgi:hypothetical protein
MRNRCTARTTLGLLSLLVAVALFVVPGALADQSVTDPTGDAASAPDVSAVSVSGDQAGNVTVTIATTQAQLGPNSAFFAFFDTDSNAATGMQEAGLGAEYFLIADDTGAFLAEVQGTTIFIHLTSTAVASYSGGTETIRVNRSDLGNAERFQFLVESDQDDGNGNTIAADQAPDGPPYPQFSFASASTLTLSLAQLAAAPRKPIAGKPFVVSAKVTRSDGAPFDAGTAVCKAKAGTKSLRTAGSVGSGSARCSMKLPRGTRGKRLRGSISVSAPGAATVARPFAFRIG